ncbi:NAD(P)-dependent oxidoreductase [Alteraurantiacibacter aquimixticola]|uniref:NAD(P)-dependent oxidoreductase n=1 Tax=Alteraurantiacibacter aquimixticola TaxID=2489173 RepID=A0A4T3EZ36_9SPHN|nr:NAD(P)-dependent oxidoreductase [Alteraurantiacibacter aquimixticola]TIX48794.1 NAD(P)-dependent oxidoreductase [Alteraurantiacibacter aquimixticola]
MEEKLALVGFGEAGSTFALAGDWQGAAAWDLLPERREAAREAGLVSAEDAATTLGQADLVLSLVTADQAVVAAQDYAGMLKPGTIWCDLNSVSPPTKRAAAAAIEAAGGHYVDGAILAPVNPARLNVPVLLSGAKADAARDLLTEAGFAKLSIVGDTVGAACAIKMIRSVMVKGIEALTWECAAAAEQAGVLEEVMASLDASDKPWSWLERTAYNRERMETHGLRRAAEMEEVAKTLRDLGVEPVMSEGTVRRQREAALTNRERDHAA